MSRHLSAFLFAVAFGTTPSLSFAALCPSDRQMDLKTTLEVTNMAPGFKAIVSVEMKCKSGMSFTETRKSFKKNPVMPDGRAITETWSGCLIEEQDAYERGHFIVRLEAVQTGDSIVLRIPAVNDGYSRMVQFNGRAFSVESRWQQQTTFTDSCIRARSVNAGLTIRE